MMLLRMSPIMPFCIMNYGLGATSISVKDFALGGFGMIPEMVIILYFGTAINSVTKAATGDYEKGAFLLIVIIIGSVIGILTIFYISYLAKQELDKTMDEDELLGEHSKVEMIERKFSNSSAQSRYVLLSDN